MFAQSAYMPIHLPEPAWPIQSMHRRKKKKTSPFHPCALAMWESKWFYNLHYITTLLLHGNCWKYSTYPPASLSLSLSLDQTPTGIATIRWWVAWIKNATANGMNIERPNPHRIIINANSLSSHSVATSAPYRFVLSRRHKISRVVYIVICYVQHFQFNRRHAYYYLHAFYSLPPICFPFDDAQMRYILKLVSSVGARLTWILDEREHPVGSARHGS